MAYPFAQAPTFAELRDRLKAEFNTDLKTDHDGVQYFERNIDSQILTYPITDYDVGDRVALWVVRSICRRLNVHPNAFGMNLG
jgi:hypothetical protein